MPTIGINAHYWHKYPLLPKCPLLAQIFTKLNTDHFSDDNTWLRPGPSFAQLMQDGKSVSEFQAVKHTRKVKSTEVKQSYSMDDDQSGEELAAPQFQQSFGSAIQQALDQFKGGNDGQKNGKNLFSYII